MALPQDPVRKVDPSLGVVWRPVWRTPDAKVRADAIALWTRMGALPEGVAPEARADQICVAAYVGDTLAAVSTAEIEHLEFLQANFAMWRVLVAPEFREHAISREISAHGRKALEDWSLAHPDEALRGIGTVVENARIQSRPRRAVFRSSGLGMVGYSQQGTQVRLGWFGHATVAGPLLPAPVIGKGPGDGSPPEGVTFRPAWKARDPEIRADALALWAELGVLPPGVDPERRTDQICVAAYQADRLVGLCSAEVLPLDFLRQRMAMVRVLTAPAARGADLARRLVIAGRDLLEDWSADHPEEAVMGIGALIDTPDLARAAQRACWPTTGLQLARYTDRGGQIRIYWFAHARI